MKILKFVGFLIYGIVLYYLLWLFFDWITPYVMNVGWILFILYLIFAGGTVSLLIGQLGYTLSIPMLFFTKGCKASKYPPILFGLYFGYQSVICPWEGYTNFGILQWLLAISLTIQILILFIGLMVMPFNIDEDEDEEE